MKLNVQGSLFALFLGALAALPPISIDMALPALGPIAHTLHVTPGLAQLTLSFFMAGFALSPIAYGPFSDRYGRRPMLILGLALFTLGGFACAVSGTLNLLLLARFVQGAGAGSGMTLAMAMVRDLFVGKKAQGRLAVITVVTNAAPMVAPALGAALLSHITAIVAGDFNGDGKTDLVSAGANGTDLTIYYGNGDGTFTLGSTVDLPFDPQFMLAADFNADGKTDLIVATEQGITVLLGKGDGTFTTATEPGMPGYATSLLAGDFNGDGKLDLAVGNYTQTVNPTDGSSGVVSVFLGNGDGTFNAVPDNSPDPSTQFLVMADLNQDGIPDLVSSNFNSSGVTLLLGKGDGTFSISPVMAPTDTYPGATVAADFNGDGIPDLATVNDALTIAINITEPKFRNRNPDRPMTIPFAPLDDSWTSWSPVGVRSMNRQRNLLC